jgi:hypothetical protein
MKKNVRKNAGMLLAMAALCGVSTALAQTPDLLVCSDKGYTLTSTADATAGATYKWLEKVNDVAFAEVSGETGVSLHRNAKDNAGTYAYVRVAFSEDCTEGVSSNTFTVVVLKPTVPVINVVTAAVCQNAGDLTFTLPTADNTTYTWSGATGNTTGDDKSTYTVSGAAYGTKEVLATASVLYTVGGQEKTCTSALSEAASAIVNPLPVVANISDYEECGSGEKELEVEVTAGDATVTGTASITWYADNDTGSTKLKTGVGYATYSPELIASATYYVGAEYTDNAITCPSAAPLTPVTATINLYEGTIGGISD